MKPPPSVSASVSLGKVLILGGLLLFAGCSERSGSPNNNNDNVSTIAAPPTDDAEANAGANASASVDSNVSTTAAGVLVRYVGKHPSEPVGGKRFLDEPIVRSAVAATESDPKVRDFVFNYDGPDAPIVMKDGRILAWGCERHNCGYHNWSVSITPEGSSAEVCFYHNDDSADGPSTWYLPDGKTEKRPGNCPSD